MDNPILLIPVLCVQLLVLYFLFKFGLSFVFAKLTAHWISICTVASIILALAGLTYFGQLGLVTRPESPSGVVLGFAISALIALNFVVLPLLYGWDKRLAMKNHGDQTRVPENALHALTFAGGIVGAMIGQVLFKHKVSKQSFQTKHRWTVAASLLLYAILMYALFS